MNDLISRAAACDEIGKMIREYREKDDHDLADAFILTRRYILRRLPAVDAVPVVHARWQGVSPFVDTEECSNCRYNIQSEELETPYCPWCGAKMDDGQQLAFTDQSGAEWADNPTV